MVDTTDLESVSVRSESSSLSGCTMSQFIVLYHPKDEVPNRCIRIDCEKEEQAVDEALKLARQGHLVMGVFEHIYSIETQPRAVVTSYRVTVR